MRYEYVIGSGVVLVIGGVVWYFTRVVRGAAVATPADDAPTDTTVAEQLPPSTSSTVGDIVSDIGASVGLSQPRGIRNNNPGNLRTLPASRAYNGQVGDDNGYGVYDTPANGVRALSKQLQKDFSRGETTLTGLITTWAPPSENNTSAYIDAVSQETGIDPNAQFDLYSNLPIVAAAIIHHENGQQPYDGNDLATWVYAS